MGNGRWERLISQPIGSSGSSLFSFNPFPDLQRERFSSCKVFVSARRRSCCGHGYPLDFSGRVTGGKALFVGAVGGVGW